MQSITCAPAAKGTGSYFNFRELTCWQIKFTVFHVTCTELKLSSKQAEKYRRAFIKGNYCLAFLKKKYSEWSVCQHVQYFDKFMHLSIFFDSQSYLLSLTFLVRLTKGKENPEEILKKANAVTYINQNLNICIFKNKSKYIGRF